MKLKLMLKKMKIITFLIALCFTVNAIAIDPITADASGPDFTPVKNDLLTDLLSKKCSIIDWEKPTTLNPSNPSGIILPAPGRTPSADDKVHSFDRPQDAEGIYVLLELVEQLSARSKLERVYPYNPITGQRAPDVITSEMKFADGEVIRRAVDLGYLRQMQQKIDRGGKKLDVPAWENTYILPTNCGTFLFSKYANRCISGDRKVIPKFDLYATVTQYDDTTCGTPCNPGAPDTKGRVLSEPYFISDFYIAPTSINTIAEDIYDKKAASNYGKMADSLQNLQTGLELIPYVSSISAITKIIAISSGGADDIYSLADKYGIAADVILDAMPGLAALSSLKKHSKSIYLIGSGAIVAAQVARARSMQKWKPELQDYLRLLVFSITSVQMRGDLAVWDAASRVLKRNPKANDIDNALKEIGLNSAATPAVNKGLIAAAFHRAKNGMSYFFDEEYIIKNAVKNITTPHGIAVAREADTLVNIFKIAGTFQETVYRDTRAFAQKIVQKIFGEMDGGSATVRLLDDLSNYLIGLGKKVTPKRVTLDADDWTIIMEARKYADDTIVNLPIPPNSTYEKEFNILFQKAVEGEISTIPTTPLTIKISNKIGGNGAVYDYMDEGESIFGVIDDIPTHYTVDPVTLKRTFYSNAQNLPPNAILTDAASLRRLIDPIEKASQAEELIHSAVHHDKVKLPGQTPTGHQFHNSGLGMTTPINTQIPIRVPGKVSVALLPKSIHTPNIKSWIDSLSPSEIVEILTRRGFDLTKFTERGAIQKEVKNIFEMDFFLMAYETRGFLTSRFRKAYLVRGLVEEAFDRGIVTLVR